MESLETFSVLFTHCMPKLLIAFLCGGVIGLDRELRAKPAGLRTNMLICGGAALFTLMSVMIAEQIAGSDPGRIAAQVVTGIGFLGAGSIIHSGATVMGLTSAATIWIVAGIGMVIGAGYPLLGLAATATVFVILHFLTTVEQRLHRHRDSPPGEDSCRQPSGLKD
jgi:putative Mg2+ transporter-C (MgtC) family protein